MPEQRRRPLVLAILDGWGYRSEQEANAIAAAHTPCFNQLWEQAPHTLLAGSGTYVGLPEGQMGNSEVGHLNIGAGRIVYQDLSRIDLAISQGDFYLNSNLINALNLAKKNRSVVHVMGLVSPGGVHSHEQHFFALIKLAASLNITQLHVHAFLDGRDTPPQSATSSISRLEAACKEYRCGHIASMIGRYYAMDRDNRWERIHHAYQLIVEAKAAFHASSAQEALEMAYQRGESDEFVQATAIHHPNTPPSLLGENDIVIFMNFRADRARELTQALIHPYFSFFPRPLYVNPQHFFCLTEYDASFEAEVIFPPTSLDDLLAEVLSRAGLKQLRLAETEKYAHVTFFFNGGRETPFPGEDRKLIPSPSVPTYDLQPEMSAPELTECLIHNLPYYDVIICNFANPDMVGHTGNFAATVKAIETVDACLTKIVAALAELDGELIITADHGNAEKMYDPLTNQPHTAHTSDPVPFIYVGRPAKIVHKNGKLSDIAPTMLYLLNLKQPSLMTGHSLLELG